MSAYKGNEPEGVVEKHILEAIRGIKYGAVEVLIHDSRIVQVEKTEKVRFEPARSAT